MTQGGAHWMDWRWTVLERDAFGDVVRRRKAKNLDSIREDLAPGEEVEVLDRDTGVTRIIRGPRRRT